MRSRPPEPLQSRMAAREQSRFVPLLALVYGFGIWLAPRVEAGLWPLWLAAGAAFLWLALWLGRKPLRYACLPLVAMAAMLYAFGCLHAPMPAAGAYKRITATVYGNPALRENGNIAVTVCRVTLDGEPQTGKAYLTLYKDAGNAENQLFDGAEIVFAGSAYHPQGKQNRYDFDFRLWLLQNGITYGLTGAREITVLNTPETAPWVDFATRIRNLCSERLRSLMGEESSLAMGMLLGEEDQLAEEQQTVFQKAGVMHLMSVSGLHVALIAGALLWLFRVLALRKAVRIPITALLIVLYCAVTGFSAASVRATVMILLLLLAQAAGRKPDPLTTLSAAALIVLALKPLDLFSAGFVLSFSAMAGILLIYPPLIRRFATVGAKRHSHRKRGRWRRAAVRLFGKPSQILAFSLAAQAGVLLPTAEYFHWLPLYGILFNLLAVPLAGLLVPLYAITLLLSAVPLAGDVLGYALGAVAQAGSKALLWLVGLTAYLPFAQVRVPAPTVWAYAAFAFSLVTVSRYVRVTHARRAIAVALAALIALGGGYATRPAELRYHQLAVGQGDAALVMDGNLTVAIDVGTYGSEAAQRLLAEGRDVDALILTHLHLDHAQGVALLLKQGIAIRQAYLPSGAGATQPGEEGYATLALLREKGIQIRELSAGDTLTFHQASVEVLWPQAGGLRDRQSVNDGSLVTLLKLDQLRILGMADVTSLYERYAEAACDVLKVGHHGSANATSDTFLSQANPRVALVTCKSGAALPADTTLQRLAAAGAQVLRTDLTGEIIIEARPEGYRILTYKAGDTDEP